MKGINIASWSTAADAGMKHLKSYPDPVDRTLQVYTIIRKEWLEKRIILNNWEIYRDIRRYFNEMVSK